MSEPITVFVGAIGGAGHGEQIVKALRLAGAGRYRIVGGDASRYCPQFGLVDVPVLLPKASESSYIDAVLALSRRFGVKAVFHGCEPELLAFHRSREVFAHSNILLPINAPEVIEICMDKTRTAAFLATHGFDPPASRPFTGRETIAAVETYPVVVKPAKGGGGSRDAFIAQTPRQLESLADFLDVANESFLIQDYVGRFEEEYTVSVLHDLDGRLIHSIAIRRLINSALNMRLAVRNRTGRADLGDWLVISSGISHGEVADFPEVRAQCETIAQALGAKGPINIQCRFVEGRVRVFEINPRFSGTTSLRAMVGYNEPDLLLRRHLLGEDIPARFPYRHGWIIRSLHETLLPDAPPPFWSEVVGEA
jgi:carbamoyl-phosphate synthase large subunit